MQRAFAFFSLVVIGFVFSSCASKPVEEVASVRVLPDYNPKPLEPDLTQGVKMREHYNAKIRGDFRQYPRQSFSWR